MIIPEKAPSSHWGVNKAAKKPASNLLKRVLFSTSVGLVRANKTEFYELFNLLLNSEELLLTFNTACPKSSDPFYNNNLLNKMDHYFLDIVNKDERLLLKAFSQN